MSQSPRLEIQRTCIEARCELKNHRRESLAAAAHVQRERILRVVEAEVGLDIRAIDPEGRSIDHLYRRGGSGVGTADPTYRLNSLERRLCCRVDLASIETRKARLPTEDPRPPPPPPVG